MAATTRERSRIQDMSPDVDETVATYIKNLEDNITNMERKMRELDGGLTQIKSGIPVLRESLESKQVFRPDFTKEIKEVNAKKIAEAEERGKRLEQENDNLVRELSKLQQSTEKTESEISTLSEKLRKTEQELKSIQTRLSEVMGNKLMDNNPDIADLSDQFRPSKLAEKYSELYDNEWTDAFEAIQTVLSYGDTKCVKCLKNILMYINKLCIEKWQDYVHGFKDNIKRGQNFEVPDYINKQLKDITKSFAPRMVGDIFKEIMHESSNLDETSKLMFQLEGVKTYTEVCVEICWLMAAQDPPVFLKADYEPEDEMDTTVLKAYTQQGETIEFLVWPPLFLYENGPLLTKGVAQAVGSRRAQSRNNTKDTDKLLRPTTHRPPKNAWSTTEENSPITEQTQTSTNMETEDTTQRPVSFQGNHQQTNVNTGLHGQTGISPTNAYQLQPSYGSFENKITDNTNTATSNIQGQHDHIGQNPSDQRQQQLHVPIGTQQQHIKWNHHRLPTQSELERYNGCIYRNNLGESYTKQHLGIVVFELCRDFCLYRNMLLEAGSQVPELSNY